MTFTFEAATATLRTLAEIIDVGRALMASLPKSAEYEPGRMDEEALAARHADTVVVWLLVGYQLGEPWRTFAAAVVTGRHRGWRALA